MNTNAPPPRPADEDSRGREAVLRWFWINLGVPAAFVATMPFHPRGQDIFIIAIVEVLAFIVVMAALNIWVAIALSRGKHFNAVLIWAGSMTLSFVIAWAYVAMLDFVNLLH